MFEALKDGRGEIRVSYRRTIYVFSIRPAYEKVTTPYRRSATNPRNKIDPHAITKGNCQACGELTQFGVCMNQDCTTNRPMSENEAVAA